MNNLQKKKKGDKYIFCGQQWAQGVVTTLNQRGNTDLERDSVGHSHPVECPKGPQIFWLETETDLLDRWTMVVLVIHLQNGPRIAPRTTRPSTHEVIYKNLARAQDEVAQKKCYDSQKTHSKLTQPFHARFGKDLYEYWTNLTFFL